MINGKQNIKTNTPAIFNLGFRPFFLGASIFSIVTISLWFLVINNYVSLIVNNITLYQWHAHEMIYGYSIAVIAGFLLTAVRNWTGVQTLNGKPLAILFGLWVIARVLFLFGTQYLLYAALFDLAFSLYLGIAIVTPIIKVKQWKQLGVLAKIILLTIGNICFYLGFFGYMDNGVHIGIYGGLYLIIGLVMTIGRRVIPFFIERGVGYEIKLINYRWVDISNLILILVFFISELFLNNANLSAVMAFGLFITNSTRLYFWHTPGIWKKPLLWSLFLSLMFIDLGFLLFALIPLLSISKFIALHALAFGGIGIITLSMMSRVSLGHTGRNINEPSVLIKYALILFSCGAVVRVFLPLVMMDYYLSWIVISQLLWITSFLLFAIVYTPILTQPRADGESG